MEVASAPTKFSARVRLRAFEKECARLRPMGEAYVRRRFSGQLGDADAEDAVSEVLLRLHRQIEAGRAPANLQAAFFTGVRNASIDILRSRAARPTVGLEAVADAAADSVTPFERAESAEDAVRLQEALGRMRGNYREAVVLRFGLGLTVPEIAEQMGISLPAAKKLVLRATSQARKRLEAIDEHEFCPEMQDAARRAVYDREAVGVLDSEESKVLHAHFRHCGRCRSFLARLHEDLHEIGGSVLVASGVGWHFGVLERVRGLVEGVGHVAGAAHDRARMVGYRISGAFSSGDGAASGAFASGQKVAAVCTASVAGAATCLASGVVGPGIGIGGSHHHSKPVPKPSSAKVKSAPKHVDSAPSRGLVVAPPPVVNEGPVAAAPAAASGFEKPKPRGSQAREAKKAAARKESHSPVSRAEETEAEFGFEAGAGGGESTASTESAVEPESTQTVQSETTTQVPATSSGSSSSSSSSSSGGGGSSGGSDFGGFEK